MFSSNEKRVPLTGAGCVLRTIDRENRRDHGASHLSQLVLSLNDRTDPDAVRAFFRKLFRTVPRLSAPVRRPYGLGYPSYCVPLDEPSRGNIIRTHSRSSLDYSQPVPSITRRLNAVLNVKQGQLMAVDYVRGQRRSQLALTWSRMLFDRRGVEVFAERLADAWTQWDRMNRFPEKSFESDADAPAGTMAGELSWSQRFRVTRDWSDRVASLTEASAGSLSKSSSTAEQDLNTDVTVLNPERTDQVSSRIAEIGDPGHPMVFYLAVSMRAHHAVLATREESEANLLVPVSVNLREGTRDPVYGNQVSFLPFTAAPDHLKSLPGLVDHLRNQRRDLIEEKFHEKTAIALETIKYWPTWFHRRLIRDPYLGKSSSFRFTWTGELLPEVDDFLGGEVQMSLFAPAVLPSPGSRLIVSRHQGRLALTHLYQEGLMTGAERDVFHDQLRSDLLDGYD